MGAFSTPTPPEAPKKQHSQPALCARIFQKLSKIAQNSSLILAHFLPTLLQFSPIRHSYAHLFALILVARLKATQKAPKTAQKKREIPRTARLAHFQNTPQNSSILGRFPPTCPKKALMPPVFGIPFKPTQHASFAHISKTPPKTASLGHIFLPNLCVFTPTPYIAYSAVFGGLFTCSQKMASPFAIPKMLTKQLFSVHILHTSQSKPFL